MKTRVREWRTILVEAAKRWDRHAAPTLSAAMAFYVLISIAPLSVIAVGLAGRVLDEASVREFILDTAARLFDPDTTALLGEILATPWAGHSNPTGTALALLVLLIASTAGFNHLRGSLNRIFESPPPEDGIVHSALRGRALAFAVVLGFGVTITVSLLLRTALVALGSVVTVRPPVPLPLFTAIEVVLLLAILTVLFAVVFRILPDQKLPWRSLFRGALVTSVLFLVGEWVIGAYLGRTGLGSAFGMAGSSVVLAAWVYYSSMVFFFGAALTCAWTEQQGEEPLSPELPGSTSRSS